MKEGTERREESFREGEYIILDWGIGTID